MRSRGAFGFGRRARLQRRDRRRTLKLPEFITGQRRENQASITPRRDKVRIHSINQALHTFAL
jgi:hypothetical protein